MSSKDVQIPNSDQKIWLSYAENVKAQLLSGIPKSDDDVIYICPPTYLGMGVSGRSEDVNYQVERNAAAMLSPTNGPFYSGGGAPAKYFLKMDELVNAIDPSRGNSPSEQSVKSLQLAEEAKSNAKRAYENALSDAGTKYQNYVDEATIRNDNVKPYTDWVKSDAPGLSNYAIGVTNATSKWEQAFVMAYGNGANNVLKINKEMVLAHDRNHYHPGYNMPAVYDIPLSKEITEKDIYHLPTYSLSGYKDRLATWKESDNFNYHHFEIDTKSGNSSSWDSLGHSETSASSGNKLWVVFNNSSETKDETTSKTSKLESRLSQISFSLRLKELNVFPVSRGDWDHPDIRTAFQFMPKTPEAQDFVVPTAMLIGYGVGLSAEFRDEAKAEAKELLDTFHSDKSAGLNILGIQIRGEQNNANTTHTGKDALAFNEAKGVLSIDPEKNLVPVLLGVLGRKIKM